MHSRLFIWCLLFWAVAGFPLPSIAAPESSFTHRHWMREDGLPDNATERLLMTRDGWIWVGTRNGLARFDGFKFTIYDARTPGFTSDAILDLVEDSGGSIWIATKKGVYRKQGGTFTRFTQAEGLLHNQVNQLLADPGGGIWMATLGGLNFFKSGRMQSFQFSEAFITEDNKPGTTRDISSLAFDESGSLLLGTLGGLYRLRPANSTFEHLWRPPVPANAELKSQAQRLLTDAQGDIWFGGEDAIYRGRGTNWTVLQFPRLAGDIRVRKLSRDPNGDVWAVRGGALFKFSPSGMEPFYEADGLSDAFVSDVLHDAQGRLWVATRFSGLHCFEPSQLRLFTTRDGLAHNSVSSVSPSRSKGLWVASMGGVQHLRGDRFNIPNKELEFAEGKEAQLVFEDRSGDIWLAASRPHGIDLTWFEAQTNGYRRLSFENGVYSPSALLEDSSGRLWIAGRLGLQCMLTNYFAGSSSSTPPLDHEFGLFIHRKRSSRWVLKEDRIIEMAATRVCEFRPGQWRPAAREETPWLPMDQAPDASLRETPFLPETEWPSRSFNSLAENPEGGIWIGTIDQGVILLKEGRTTAFSIRHGLPSDKIQCLHVDGSGTLWVGTSKGLAWLKSDRKSFGYVAATVGLPDDTPFQILEDVNRNLWVGCNRGIYRLHRKELDDLQGGRTNRVSPLLLDTTSGLISGQTTSGRQPSACRTEDGRLWFATPRGLACVTPDAIRMLANPPRVYLDSLKAGIRSISLFDERPAELLLPPGSGDSVVFEYGGVEFSRPKHVQFRFKLKGLNSEWVSNANQRFATFTNLKPGNYQFEVQSTGFSGEWLNSTASLSFKIIPHYWQTVGFQASAWILALGMLAGFLRSRFLTVQKLERAHAEAEMQKQRAEAAAALNRQRELMARDLHDDLGTKLGQLSLLGDVAAQDPSKAARLSELARDAARNLDNLVWTTHPGRSRLDQLVEYLVAFAREYLDYMGIQLILDVPQFDESLPLPDSTRKALILSAREALHNLVKHSRAHTARLTVRKEGGMLTVEIEDDGFGFPAHLLSPKPQSETLEIGNPCKTQGNGLRNLSERMTEIGGNCRLENCPGGGAKVVLRCPLPTPEA